MPLAGDQRGAVFVEFLIAFLPVFVFFLCMLQLSMLFAAKLMVDHSAVAGARAAAVVFGDEPARYGDSDGDVNTMSRPRREAVRSSVLLALAPLIVDGSLLSLNVLFPSGDKPGGPEQTDGAAVAPMEVGGTGTSMVRVRVEANVLCKIALANAIACGGFTNAVKGPFGLSPTIVVRGESIFPYQGASYAYQSKTQASN